MLRTKIFCFIALVISAFSFQGSLAAALPREKARTEIVIGDYRQNTLESQQQRKTSFEFYPGFSSVSEPVRSTFHHLFRHRLLIANQQHHSSL